jgi:hypothetical protein
VAELVMAFVLAGVIGALFDGRYALESGLLTAVIVWLGFVVTTTVVNHRFNKARPMLTAIDAGHWLAVLLVQGAILGAFG